MQVTNLDVWQAREPLEKLMAEPMPIKAAYRMAKLARKINEQSQIIDSVRVKFIQQYGSSKNGSNTVSVAPGDAGFAAFASSFNELMAEEVELTGVEKIVLPDNDVRVSPQMLMALDAFVEVE